MWRLLTLSLILLLAACAQRVTPSAVGLRTVLVCADDASGAPAQPDFDESACRTTAMNDIDPQRRAIWLRARVVIPDDLPDPLGVRISAMASSTIYWNGRELGANGRPASTEEHEDPGLMDAEIFLPRERIEPGENLIAIRMSGHDMPVRVSTPVHLITIGPYGRLREAMWRAYQPALVTSGAILLAALFFFVAFLLNRRELAALCLSLMALSAAGQLFAEASRGLIDYAYPLHVPRLIVIVVCASLFAIALNAFVATRFALRRPARWIAGAAIAVIGLGAVAPGFDGRTMAIILAGALVAIAAIARPAWRGDAGARTIAAALLVLVALIFWRRNQFLDQDFYLVVSALLGLLFVDQIFAMRRARDARDAALQRAKQLELELLRRGVAPHFLMNTLNSLAEWVEADPATGVRMIEALGEQMRALSAIGERELILLSEEVDLVRAYLAVMSYRSDTTFALEVGGALTGVAIPPGVLHTLAENGFSHNRYPAGGTFHLGVERRDESVVLTFETPRAEQRRNHASGGAGHAYVRARLESAYGQRAAFSDGATDGGAWRSTITLPAAPP